MMQLTQKERELIEAEKANKLADLALKIKDSEGLRRSVVLQQINGIQRVKDKLPEWLLPDVLFPPQLSLEQSSSQRTAQFKAELVAGNSLADLTGGFGADSYYFSKKVKKVSYFERNKDLATIVQHNFNVLKAENIEVHPNDSITFLGNSERFFDWIYLDPARRDIQKNRVFLLSDCTPDVSKIQDILLAHTENVLVKLSPIMDITAVLAELQNVRQIWLVAVKNEVKELLVHFGKNPINEKIKISAINFTESTVERFDSYFLNKPTLVEYSDLKTYLYEPNRALLKAGLQDKAAAYYHLPKVGVNSHFYTSDEKIEDYPGRIFLVKEKLKGKIKSLKKYLPAGKANIIARNYPLKASVLFEKYKIKPGGDTYLIATTLEKKEKVIILAQRLK